MSIIGVTVMKVSHANAILQLVDCACVGPQDLAETKIRNFHFSSFFCKVAARANVGR